MAASGIVRSTGKKEGGLVTRSNAVTLFPSDPDGREQQARDRGMRASLSGEQYLRSTNQWSDPRVQLWLYAHDAEASAKEVLNRLSQNVVEAAVANGKGAANGHGSTSSHIDEMIAWGLLSSSNA